MRAVATGLLPPAALLLASLALAQSPDGFRAGMKALLAGDFAEAWCHWKPLAERGHAESQYNLGWLYANGNGVNVDMDRAFHWWQRAAAQGHADAEFAIALAYTTGEGIDRDLKKAVQWFLRAAEQGHPDARDILIRLAGDPEIDLLETAPELLDHDWFGWPGRVVRPRVNLRAGPGLDRRVIGSLEQGARVRVVGRRGDWLRIHLPAPDSPRATAWVYHRLLEPEAPAS